LNKNPTPEQIRDLAKKKQEELIKSPKFSVTFSYPHNFQNLTEHFMDSFTNLLLHETGKSRKDRILGSILKEGSCYVSFNRGRIVVNFINSSQDSHLLMVDPDISFKPDILEQFKILVEHYPEAGIIAARVDVRNGLPVFYYQHPDKISTVQYSFPFLGIKEFDYVGTGIILISRKVLFDLFLRFNHCHFFNMIIEPETNRLLGDDLSFCKIAKENGHKVYGAWEVFGQHHKDFPVPSRYPSLEDVKITKR